MTARRKRAARGTSSVSVDFPPRSPRCTRASCGLSRPFVARRHPGWLTKSIAYGLAGAVSFSRVTSGDHFPSDVAAGSVVGFLIGRYVSRDTGLAECAGCSKPAKAQTQSPRSQRVLPPPPAPIRARRQLGL